MIYQMARGLGMVVAKRCSLSAVRRKRLLVTNCPALASHQMTRSYVLDNGPKVKSDHRSGTMVDGELGYG